MVGSLATASAFCGPVCLRQTDENNSAKPSIRSTHSLYTYICRRISYQPRRGARPAVGPTCTLQTSRSALRVWPCATPACRLGICRRCAILVLTDAATQAEGPKECSCHTSSPHCGASSKTACAPSRSRAEPTNPQGNRSTDPRAVHACDAHCASNRTSQPASASPSSRSTRTA